MNLFFFCDNSNLKPKNFQKIITAATFYCENNIQLPNKINLTVTKNNNISLINKVCAYQNNFSNKNEYFKIFNSFNSNFNGNGILLLFQNFFTSTKLKNYLKKGEEM